MQPISNEVLIEGLEQRVEAHILEGVKVFQNLDEDVLMRPSATGGWSIAQCLWHLNSYGHYYLPRIKDAIQQVNGTKSNGYFRSGRMGNYFTQIMEPGNGKGMYKANKRHMPPISINGHETVAEFIQQQETLLENLAKAREVNLNTIRIPVSVFSLIKLKLGDVFQFIIAHNERHIQQARKNC